MKDRGVTRGHSEGSKDSSESSEDSEEASRSSDDSSESSEGSKEASKSSDDSSENSEDSSESSESSEDSSESSEGSEESEDSSKGSKDSSESSEGDDEPSTEEMAVAHHRQTAWIYWTVVMLGVWMLVSPLTFGYGDEVARPSGGRELWLSDAMRVAVARWSDIGSGALLIFFGWRSLRPARPISLWICCGVGVWLTFAPILFWAPSALIYLNDTIVGALVIALTILIPGMPSMMRYMKMGGANPPGWSYNPSSWAQRSILIALGLAGWLVSRYLAAYQLGYLESVWEPFFGGGSRRVLDSQMSHALPISDAGFGAIAYTFEFLMGFMGSPARWRTMPWMVTLFGILVIPLGLVHILLVASQPLVVGSWCTMCLLAAAIMLPMLPLEVDEVIAMGQHLRRARERGEKLWTVFWMGGSAQDAGKDERSPDFQSPDFAKIFRSSLWGVSAPLPLSIAAAAGVWLMASSAALGIQDLPSDFAHVAGALLLTTSVVAMSEPLRALRFLNIPIALALPIASFFAGASSAALVSGGLTGLAVAALSLPRGVIRESYDRWQAWIR